MKQIDVQKKSPTYEIHHVTIAKQAFIFLIFSIRLGMTHDGLDNTCKMQAGGFPHVMAAQWPTRNQVSMKWSQCSYNKLIKFLR